MAQQPTSKKWVDYSDSDSSDDSQPKQQQQSPARPHHKPSTPQQKHPLVQYTPSQKQIDQQLDHLDDFDYNRVDQVWIDLFSQNLDYLQNQIKQLTGKAKKGGNIVQVLPTHEPHSFLVKVYIDTAYDWIQNGYKNHDYIQITVSERNFHKNQRYLSPRSKDTGRYQDNHRQKQHVGANNKNEKKKYVDKQTGKAPQSLRNQQSNPQSTSASIRGIYTRHEAQLKAQGLAGFRSKAQPILKDQEPEKEDRIQKKERDEADLNEEAELKEDAPISKKQEIQEYEKSQMSGRKEREESKKQRKKKQGDKGKSGNPFDGMLDL